MMFAILQGAYLRRNDRANDQQDWAFTFTVLNVVTFAIVWVMGRAQLDMGVGLGLFAVFGILRYRTEPLAIRDLTYLFASIGLAVMHGLEQVSLGLGELLLLDAAILAAILAFDRTLEARPEVKLTYDRVELIAPGRRQELITDLRERFGLRVLSVRVSRIDALRDTADLRVELESAP